MSTDYYHLLGLARRVCDYFAINPDDRAVQYITQLMQQAYDWGLTGSPDALQDQCPDNKIWMAPMNYSTVICLVSTDVRGIACAYEYESDGKTPKKIYTYKSLDKSIVVDDLVIVPTSTRMGFTCVKVIEVDVEIEIESNIDYKWIAGRFDNGAYQEILRQEQVAIVTIKQAKKTRARRELKETILEDVDESSLTQIGIFRGEMPASNAEIAETIEPPAPRPEDHAAADRAEAIAPDSEPDDDDYHDADGTINGEPNS